MSLSKPRPWFMHLTCFPPPFSPTMLFLHRNGFNKSIALYKLLYGITLAHKYKITKSLFPLLEGEKKKVKIASGIDQLTKDPVVFHFHDSSIGLEEGGCGLWVGFDSWIRVNSKLGSEYGIWYRVTDNWGEVAFSPRPFDVSIPFFFLSFYLFY